MTPNYIDFVCFCLFVISIASLVKKFYNNGKVTKEDVNRLSKELSRATLLKLVFSGFLSNLLLSFYHGLLLWLTYESFFKVLLFLILQIN